MIAMVSVQSYPLSITHIELHEHLKSEINFFINSIYYRIIRHFFIGANKQTFLSLRLIDNYAPKGTLGGI